MGDIVMVSMSDDKSKGYRFGSHLWCIAAANHIRALLQLCYWIATGSGLPQIFYMDCMEASSELWVEIQETKWLTLAKWGCVGLNRLNEHFVETTLLCL